MHCGHFYDDLVQRQIAFGRHPLPQPAAIRGQLARGMIVLDLRSKTPGLALQDHHVVHKARRHQEVPRRLTMPMPLLDKCGHRLRNSTGCSLPIIAPHIWQDQETTNPATWES